MTGLQALLDVQRFDNELDQLRYRRENLPERASLVVLAEEEASLAAAVAQTESTRDELRRRQRALEDDASDMEERAKISEARLYDGTVTSPREATALGDEIAGLRERRSVLEDQAIELLLEIEPLDAQLDRAGLESERMSAQRAELESTLARDEQAIDADIVRVEGQRASAAAGVDDAILDQYRKLRITYGPDAIVEFDPSRGGGCPVAMSAVELDRWKHLPAGTIEPCTDCGRLVVKLT